MKARYCLCSLFACLILTAEAASQSVAEEPTQTVPEQPALRQLGSTEQLIPESNSVSLPFLLTERLLQDWDASASGGEGAWTDLTRTTYTRNSAGAIFGILTEAWDVSLLEWVPSTRTTSQLNAQGLSTETLSEFWDPEANDGEGDWMPISRRTATFNAQGNPLIEVREMWNPETGEFDITNRNTSTYDSSGELRTRFTSESVPFGGTSLEPSFRYTFTYDDGLWTGRVTEHYNDETQEWVNSAQRQFTYDSNGAEIEERNFSWDADAGDWTTISVTTTVYTPNSLDPSEIAITEQDWDASAGEWVNDSRGFQTITDVGMGQLEIEEISQDWDAFANNFQGAWVNEDRSVYHVLEDDFSFIDVVEQDWDEDLNDWVNIERFSYEYDEDGQPIVQLGEAWDGANWVNDFRILDTYENFTGSTAEEETPSQRFRLEANYPNPFREETTIRFTLATPERVTVEVYDVLGRRVATLVDDFRPTGSHEVKFVSSKLAGGLYVYRLRGENISASRTMLLVK